MPLGRRVLLLCVLCLAAACTVGSGSGEVTTTVTLEACELRDATLELNPTFFAAQAIEDSTIIRIQRGGQAETFSDGIILRVADATEVASSRLGAPLDVGIADDSLTHRYPVTMTVYLNDTCREPGAASLVAVAGTATFHALYAPEHDESERLIEGTFAVTLSDPDAPERDRGSAEGWFHFFYTRGRPAQPFP